MRTPGIQLAFRMILVAENNANLYRKFVYTNMQIDI